MNNLSLTELVTLYNIIDNGLYDGNSTSFIRIEAAGFQYGHEKWKNDLKDREEILFKIRFLIRLKAKNMINIIDSNESV